jgi:hypothetical protein
MTWQLTGRKDDVVEFVYVALLVTWLIMAEVATMC